MSLDYKLIDEKDIRLKKSPAKFIFTEGNNIAKDMADNAYKVMMQYNGVGLSANQIGINLQFFVMGFDSSKRYVFNPEILESANDNVMMKEGCLSFPGMFLTVKRPSWIHVRYQNELGEIVEEKFTGLTARIFQHEYDHMQGVVFTDKVSKLKLDLATKKRIKILKKYVANVATDAINEAKKDQDVK